MNNSEFLFYWLQPPDAWMCGVVIGSSQYMKNTAVTSDKSAYHVLYLLLLILLHHLLFTLVPMLVAVESSVYVSPGKASHHVLISHTTHTPLRKTVTRLMLLEVLFPSLPPFDCFNLLHQEIFPLSGYLCLKEFSLRTLIVI